LISRAGTNININSAGIISSINTGTTYADANRLNYQFISVPIGDSGTYVPIVEPTSSPSITSTTITGTDYKYMTFINDTPNLVHNFTNQTNLSSWTSYATSRGMTTNVNNYALSGVSRGGTDVGQVSYVLPNTHDFIEVRFKNALNSGTVNLLINNVIQMTANGGESKIYTGAYTAGQTLKIDEQNTLISKDLMMILSKQTQTTYNII